MSNLNDLLCLAVEAGDYSKCAALLAEGADANSNASTGVTALGMATKMGRIDVCRLLIERGARVSIQELIGAVGHDHVEALKVLLERTPRIDAVLRRVFFDAVNGNHGACCEVLIEAGVRPTEGDLALAARKNFVRVCEALVKHGVAVSGRDSTGRTPLHAVAASGSVEAGRFLLENGADVNIETDLVGWTPLYETIDRPSKRAAEMCRLLVRAGADTAPACDSPEQLTPFQFAITRGNAAVVRALADECDEDPGQRTAAGKTMLELASDWHEVAEVLRAMQTEHAVSVVIAPIDDGRVVRSRGPSMGSL